MRIAVVVLGVTQLLNLALVPWLAHAGLALSIGLGAMVNATWLGWGLRRNGTYRPCAGWGRLVVQVVLACAVLCVWLVWMGQRWDWTALGASPWMRVGLLGVTLIGSAVLYFGCLILSGVQLRALFKR